MAFKDLGIQIHDRFSFSWKREIYLWVKWTTPSQPNNNLHWKQLKMISEHIHPHYHRLQVNIVGNFLKRRYHPLKMGQRCLLLVHLLLFSFESVLIPLTNMSHTKPYKLDLYSWQKTIHSEHVVLSSSCLPPISAVTSLIFSDRCQLFLLLILTKSSLNYDIFLHLTFCFSSLSPSFSILIYREKSDTFDLF